MSARPGHEKAGGRQKGTKNKVSTQVKERLAGVIAKYVLTTGGVRNLEADLEVLRPVDRVTIIEKLMKYCIPTLGSMKIGEVDSDEPLTVNVRWTKAKPKDVDDDANALDYSEDCPEDDEDEEED